MTGSEVPTIRSCVAALLVLAAMALGREALTLRLVATGALFVLLLWPESLAGPSFQLSFAAVTAIIALAEHPRVRGWFAPREEGWGGRMLRGLGSLLLTGIAVEVALMPIAVFHFHKAGIYGALANIVAIPLTTFVVMPLEAMALVLDLAGLGGPIWWLAGQALALLLWIARTVAQAPAAVAALPAMPRGAFALMIAGGLWLALWRTQWRRLGLVPVLLGAGWAFATPAPDLLVTGDGRHVGVRLADGRVALLRDRAGDYARDMLAENGGSDDEPVLLSEERSAACSRDLCRVDVTRGGRRWRVLATRSAYLVPAGELIAACARADIVISERRLPRRCAPRWLRLDRATLARTGGVAVSLSDGRIETVYRAGDAHPWVRAALAATKSDVSAARQGIVAWRRNSRQHLHERSPRSEASQVGRGGGPRQMAGQGAR
jgi:competence protein ComEC